MSHKGKLECCADIREFAEAKAERLGWQTTSREMDWSIPRAGSRSILRCLAMSCCQKKLVSPDTGWEDAESDAMKPTRSGVFSLLARTLWLRNWRWVFVMALMCCSLPSRTYSAEAATPKTEPERSLRLAVIDFEITPETEHLRRHGKA